MLSLEISGFYGSREWNAIDVTESVLERQPICLNIWVAAIVPLIAAMPFLGVSSPESGSVALRPARFFMLTPPRL